MGARLATDMLEAERYQGALSDGLKDGRNGRNRKKKCRRNAIGRKYQQINMQLAYKGVTGNKGAAGVDDIGAANFAGQLKAEWEGVKTKLETGQYQPQAVKRVRTKPNGGERKLGIPTYMDRLIQQAISQELTKLYDAGFSENSYGFRAEKNAHQAML